MNPEQQQAILTLALLAAFADGANDEREREQIRRLAESLGGEPGAANLPAIYQKVILKQASLKEAAATLVEPGHRQLAYEMAVCVCDADGRMTEAEKKFLAELASALGLESSVTDRANNQAEAMAELADDAAPSSVANVEKIVAGTAATTTVATAYSAPGPVVAATPSLSEAEMDKSVLNYAILNGALELLPQSWASMAIIPLQIKMVYGIGKAHGYELDQGHIRELLATLGVGLTSQYLEQFGRKLLGGLFGKVAGGLGKQLGQSATSMAFSFASTYALGQVARRYYAGGRQMNTEMLKESFQNLLGPAKEMQARYLPQIQQKASGLDATQIMAMVRGA
ncbi:DUF533 domain-containing protein [Propionivibrio sp.]|uniref:DUF533 domain-containing protein n=1 Tax=Propionivibrio sp. TaxID=2212460 RepID=UPI003BF28293